MHSSEVPAFFLVLFVQVILPLVGSRLMAQMLTMPGEEGTLAAAEIQKQQVLVPQIGTTSL